MLASGNGDTHANSATSKLTASISITAAATLDLTNNLLAVAGGANPAAVRDTIRNLIIAGRNVPVGGVGDGKWTGKGITSSTAATHFVNDGLESRVVAYSINSDLPLGSYGTFGGQSVGPNDDLDRAFGDAFLDARQFLR